MGNDGHEVVTLRNGKQSRSKWSERQGNSGRKVIIIIIKATTKFLGKGFLECGYPWIVSFSTFLEVLLMRMDQCLTN